MLRSPRPAIGHQVGAADRRARGPARPGVGGLVGSFHSAKSRTTSCLNRADRELPDACTARVGDRPGPRPSLMTQPALADRWSATGRSCPPGLPLPDEVSHVLRTGGNWVRQVFEGRRWMGSFRPCQVNQCLSQSGCVSFDQVFVRLPPVSPRAPMAGAKTRRQGRGARRMGAPSRWLRSIRRRPASTRQPSPDPCG